MERERDTYKASVVIAAYQAEDTIANAIKSVLNTARRNEIEIIVVDDGSKDRTQEIVEGFCTQYENVRYIRMPRNTGSPSEPRNTGIAQAKGVYVSTLDDDDTYDVDEYLKMLDMAFEQDLDFVKGYLTVHESERVYEANRLASVPAVGRDSIQAIVSNCSLTADYIVKKSIIARNNLKYDAKLKIGEDSVFITGLMGCAPKTAYVDLGYLHYNKVPSTVSNLSSTQRCGNREVSDQIKAWTKAEANLQKMGLSYYELRLSAGFRNLLLSIVRFSDGISKECYKKLHRFAKDAESVLRKKLVLAKRYQELFESILAGSYEEFCNVSKRRIVIAGYDLKFILPLVPYLEKEYNVQVDEWTGHNSHDEKQSRKMLEWADIIWCEWLLGNAVYYTQHKANYQRLVIRAHRFEINREFGQLIDYNKVDAVFTVSYYYLEQFSKQFSIPKAKMRLLSNYVEDQIYTNEKSDEAKFHIGLVGAVPALKGLKRALEILAHLRKTDERFKLHLMGKLPEELPWLMNDPVERAYFEDCNNFIGENNLSDAVVKGGFVERARLYGDIGIVLSLSDIESFHLAPMEAVCAGCVSLVRTWSGAEYIYPPSAIFATEEDMEKAIMQLTSDSDWFESCQRAQYRYVVENYGVNRFMEMLHRYLVQVRIMG